MPLPKPNVDNSVGGGYRLANNKFVATNLLPKTSNFCSKNSLKNQSISKAKTFKFLLKKQRFLDTKLHKNSQKNEQNLNIKKSKKILEKLSKNQFFSDLKNINFDNYFLNNQSKYNLTDTHFSNLKNININLKTIKSYYKNLHYNLIKRRHTISGLFPVSCRILNTKLNYNQYNLSKIPKHNNLIKSFLPRLQE